MARRRRIVIVQVVIPHQLFPGSNIAPSEDPSAIADFLDLAIGIARVVQISAQPFAIDDGSAVSQTIQIRAWRAIVKTVSLFRSNARPRVLYDALSFANRRVGEHSDGMNA